MKKLRENRAITLIALVITIIILLILAGITIGELTNSGLFEKTKTAENEYRNAQANEDDILKQYENAISTGEVASVRDYEAEINSLKAEVQRLKNANSYSTTEEKVVGTWIDGKNIYQRSVIIAFPNGVTDGTMAVTNYDVSLWNIATPVNIEGTFVINGLGCTLNPYYQSNSGYFARLNYNNSLKNLALTTNNSSFAGANVYITAKYTKTTD